MESTVLGTFYPLDIKGDMPGCVITNRKINAETHTSEISFSSNHIFKGKKKKAIASKNDYRTGGFTKLERRTGWDQAQTVNKSGSVLGLFPTHPLGIPAPPRDDLEQSHHGFVPRQSCRCLNTACAPRAALSHCLQSSHPTTHHTWPQTTWKTSEISSTAVSSRPLPPSWRGLGHFQILWESRKAPRE